MNPLNSQTVKSTPYLSKKWQSFQRLFKKKIIRNEGVETYNLQKNYGHILIKDMVIFDDIMYLRQNYLNTIEKGAVPDNA
jgi:hypothetical protein